MPESHQTVERALVELATRIAWPPEEDLVPLVHSRLEHEPTPRPALTRMLAAAAGFLLVVGAVLVLSPIARQAVADLLEMGGIRIVLGEPISEPPGSELDLGERISLQEATEQVDFPVLVPRLADLGPPESVYLREPPPGGQVSVVWEADGNLPAAPGSGIGLLITQFPGSPDVLAEKMLGPDTELTSLRVRGHQGFWIEHAPHLITYVDARGLTRQDEVRLAGNVLLWEEEGVTYRIESALERDEVLRIAESLEPGG